MFCKKKRISSKNLKSGWRKTCGKQCENKYKDHYYGTDLHFIQTQDVENSGRGILNPRIYVIR